MSVAAVLPPDRLALLAAAFRRRRGLLGTFIPNTISATIRATIAGRR